jgi:hypothetical protein
MRWLRSIAPDDDYLPAADPEPTAWRKPPPVPPGVTLSDERRLTHRLGFDGRIATALGRLTPTEFRAARRSGRIDANGSLVTARLPGKVTTRTRGSKRPTKVMATFTLEEWKAAQEAERRVREEAARERASRSAEPDSPRPPSTAIPLRFRVRPEWIVPLPRGSWEQQRFAPMPRRGRVHYVPVDEDPETASGDDDDAWSDVAPLDAEDLAPTFEAPDDWYWWDPADDGLDDRLPYQREMDDDGGTAVDGMVREWRAEIVKLRRDGDERFAVDGVCANPNGCPNRPKPRGNRCGSCYEYRRTHGGEERPLRLINRGRRRTSA